MDSLLCCFVEKTGLIYDLEAFSLLYKHIEINLHGDLWRL